MPQPYPGQNWRHGWVPVTATAIKSKNHGKTPKGGNQSKIAQAAAAAGKALRKLETQPKSDAKKDSGSKAAASKVPSGTPKDLSRQADDAIRAAAGRPPLNDTTPPPTAKTIPGLSPAATATFNRIADLDDPTTTRSLVNDIFNGKGSVAERQAWADAVGKFNKLAESGSKTKNHQAWLNSLTGSDDPEKATRGRLAKVKAPNLRAAAVRALEAELAARDAKAKHNTPGMQSGVRHTSGKEGVDWAYDKLPLPHLTDDEKKSVKRYTGSHFQMLNKGLRGNPPSDPEKRADYEKTVAEIDSAFDKSKLPESVTVHRGVWGEFVEHLGAKIGDPASFDALVGRDFVEKSYLSTSVGDKAVYDDSPFQIMFRVPAGHEALNVMPISVYGKQEREVMLRRNSRYIIHGVYNRKDPHLGTKWFIEAEVVPDDWSKPADWVPDPYGDLAAAHGYSH